MRRKAVDKRLKSIARLRTVIASSRDRLSCRLAERPAAPRVERFSYGPVLDHLQAELAAVERRLTAAECAYAADQAKLASARQTRNRRVSDLYTLQCDARRLLQVVLGPRQQLELHMIGDTPSRSPLPLARQVKQTIPFLRNLEHVPPPPALAVTFDAPAFADKLQADLERVETSCAALARAEHATIAARCRADEAVAEVDRVFPWVLQAFEGLCRLAGEDRLARRIRAR